VTETADALAQLKSRKAADAAGHIAELLTKASVRVPGHARPSFVLAEPLTAIINSIFRQGAFPSEESLGMIIPIYKGKGDRNLCTNHRGVTIITVIYPSSMPR